MKHNYKNYSSRGERQTAQVIDEAIPEEVKEEVAEAVVEETANMDVDVDEAASADLPEEEPKDEPLIGRVSGCKRLNIRKQPSKESDPVCVVDEDTVLMIDLMAPTPKEWYKIYTETGIEGYCMRQFVKISE